MRPNKKLLFVFPNTANSYAIPTAIAILAGIAKSFDWEMQYFDTCVYEKSPDSAEDRERSGEFKTSNRLSSSQGLSYEDMLLNLQETINIFEPDIVAFSCMSFEYQFLTTFMPDIQIPPETLVVIGGIHAVLKPDEVINSGLFDIVCIGEGENTFREILVKVENGESLSEINNTYYRDKTDGTVVKNQRNELIDQKKLWENSPDYSLFDETYFEYPFDGKFYRRLSFETSRGCPYDCSYCGNSALKTAYRGLGKFVRTRSLDSIKENLPIIIDKHHIEMIYFSDECFLSHPLAWLKEMVDWYGREIRKPFIVQTRPETVTEEKVALLKKMNAPFFQVSMGVESGSENILFNVCNRKTKINTIQKSFDILHQHKVRTCAFFMIGFPYESREDVFKSIELCRRIKPDVAIVSIFQPMPGQSLRDVCIKEGFINGDEFLPTFTGDSILNMPQMSAEQIVNLRRVFILYAMLPKERYFDIQRCETAYELNEDLYAELVGIRWGSGNESGDFK